MGIQVACEMPDLGDLPVLDVEDGHVPYVQRGFALTLSRPPLKGRRVLITRRDVVDISPERVAGDLREQGEYPENLVPAPYGRRRVSSFQRRGTRCRQLRAFRWCPGFHCRMRRMPSGMRTSFGLSRLDSSGKG